jgi:hypothetical protein
MLVGRLLHLVLCVGMLMLSAMDCLAGAGQGRTQPALSSAADYDSNTVTSDRGLGRLLAEGIRLAARGAGSRCDALLEIGASADLRIERAGRTNFPRSICPTPRLRRQLCRAGAGEVDPPA